MENTDGLFSVGLGTVVGETTYGTLKKKYGIEEAEAERKAKDAATQAAIEAVGSPRLGYLTRKVLDKALVDAVAMVDSLNSLLDEMESIQIPAKVQVRRVRRFDRNKFRIPADKIDRVRDFLIEWSEAGPVFVADIAENTFLKPQAIGRILAHLGYRRYRVARDGDRQWAYEKPEPADG